MTSATNPSLEDIIQAYPRHAEGGRPQPGARLRGRPGVHAGLVRRRGRASSTRSCSIIEGSIPNEKINGEGHWTGIGRQPARTASRSRPTSGSTGCAEGGGRRRRRHLRHLRRHPGDEEQPDRRDGPARLPGLEVEVEGRPAGRLHPRLPGAAGQHDRDAALPRAAPRRAGAGARARRGSCGRSGCSGAPCARAATAPASPSRATSPPSTATTRAAWSSSAARARWCKCNVPVRGWVNGIGGCPNVGGICMACTMPGFPDKYMPFMDEDRCGRRRGQRRAVHLRPDPALLPPPQHQEEVRHGARVAQARPELTTGYQQALVRRRRSMATVETPQEQKVVVKEMSWDPITRIVGSLGIHTEIDFTNQQVLKCYSTSMIFRGFDIFMKGIDPRDAHFITSRICGICGDNHCTCSCLNQNMAYGVKPPPLGDYALQPGRVRGLHVRPRDLQRLHGERGLLRADGQGDQPVAAREGREDRGAALATSTATGRSPTSCGR